LTTISPLTSGAGPFSSTQATDRQTGPLAGTTTLRETIDASMREVVHAKRRLELVALLSEEGRFDFEAAENAWGAND